MTRGMRCGNTLRLGVLLLVVAMASILPALADDKAGSESTDVQAPKERARGKSLIACTQILRRRWTQVVEEVQDQVLKLVETNSSLNSTTAGRQIAEQNL